VPRKSHQRAPAEAVTMHKQLLVDPVPIARKKF